MPPVEINDNGERAKATSLAAINKHIAGIARSAVKLNEAIHATGLMCMQHALDFGDAGPSARLVDALPLSHRRALLINWFGTFSPVTIGKDGKTMQMKGHLKGTAEERKDKWLMNEAKATPFYAMPEAQNEPDVPTYEKVHNSVIAFIKRTKTVIEKIPDEGEKKKALGEVEAIEKALPAAKAA